MAYHQILKCMDKVLKQVSNISADCCVTIIFNTHRTAPDSNKDPLVLKNLIREATSRVTEECGTQKAKIITTKLEALANDIQHRFNLESMAIFVNETMAEYTRLPLQVEDRISIGKTFATRDLIRSLLKDKEYYLLVLSRDSARLIKAFNDKLVAELEEGFPVENINLHPRQPAEAAIANRMTDFRDEFFNQVDKELLRVIKQDVWPVFICTEESNYHAYLKVADQKDMILGLLPGNRMAQKAQQIVSEAWPHVLESRRKMLNDRVSELKVATNTGKFVTDFNDIWRAVNEGRGKTLFVRQGYFQPARIDNGTVELVSLDKAGEPGFTDDIIDDMIEINMQNGGDCIFLSADELQQYQGLVLTTRY